MAEGKWKLEGPPRSNLDDESDESWQIVSSRKDKKDRSIRSETGTPTWTRGQQSGNDSPRGHSSSGRAASGNEQSHGACQGYSTSLHAEFTHSNQQGSRAHRWAASRGRHLQSAEVDENQEWLIGHRGAARGRHQESAESGENQRGSRAYRGSSRGGHQQSADSDDNQRGSHAYRGSSRGGHQQSADSDDNQLGSRAYSGSSRGGHQQSTDSDDNQRGSRAYRGSSREHQESLKFSGNQRGSQALFKDREGGNSAQYRGGHKGFSNGRDSGSRGFRGASAFKADRNRVEFKRNYAWNFWTLLCGAEESEVVFTEYRGYCKSANQKAQIEKGWIKVPLFQEATKENICKRFGDRLRSIASAVAECEELKSDKWRLLAHLRIGDLFLFHRNFRFDCRPGPKLEDFNLLLEDKSFPKARDQLSHFFSYTADNDLSRMTSTFVTEKPCGSHSTIEAFLDLKGFQVSPNDECLLTATLDGGKHKFELYYGLRDLRLQKIVMFTHKWNLNLVTAKGKNYRGTFREKADLRLQFDAGVFSDAEDSLDKVKECLRDNGIDYDELQQLFERIGEQPDADLASNTASVLLDDCERSYRIRQPKLFQKLTYLREQHNRRFVQSHEHWPLAVLLRQFRFFDDPDPATGSCSGKPGLELRVSAELNCHLDQQALKEPEFVSHMWDACQLIQDLIATSLEA